MGLKDELDRMDLSVSETRNGQRPRRPHASGALPAPTALMQGMAGVDQLKERASKATQLQEQLDAAIKKLATWDGSKPALLIDPQNIARSRYANRHELNFKSENFKQLKEEILASQGNLQPILVRRRMDPHDGSPEFEIIFGQRRHQACAELGIPVLALVTEANDQELFCAMERENRARKDMSPWEQGMSYRRALEAGLYPSNRKLAEAINADLGAVGKALELAHLDDDIVAAFPSPLDLQYRWAKPLKAAIAADPASVKRRAKALARQEPHPPAKTVFRKLIADDATPSTIIASSQTLKLAGLRVGKMTMEPDGSATLSFEPGVIDSSHARVFARAIEQLIADQKRITDQQK